MADMMIGVYAMESASLRTKKLIDKRGEEKSRNAIEMTIVFVQETFDCIEGLAKESLAAMEEGDILRTTLHSEEARTQIPG